MSGPLPKDPSLRQRKNRVSGAATLSADAGKKRRIPPLPKVIDGHDDEGNPVFHEWQTLTRFWWRDVWRSPMAAEYLQADVHGLYRLAILIDKFWLEPSAKLAAEIRLQQQSYGHTPIDRRRLQWEVERTEAVAQKKRTAAPAPEPQKDASAVDDPRAVLRIVSK